MKSKVMILGLLMCCLFSSAALAQTMRVSQRDALAIVQQQFEGQDVDYLILKDNNTTAWEKGGFQYEDVELPSSSSNNTNLREVRLLSPQSKIKSITLKGDEFDVVTLKFDFNKYSATSKTYSFDLVQKDEDGNIVGGETFIVESRKITVTK